ncbi:spore-associated protein A [Streptomyces formicae]|uniref:Spore-associated protein A n=1 Tax=Streptomyces formicae TaxID=1616117 RepID=A0ABY3WQE4_9ACTN|nr:spore-associated protein A [Streptomyces formicae]UNM14866.1 spore-associated protein A [Streptomyces formicae]
MTHTKRARAVCAAIGALAVPAGLLMTAPTASAASAGATAAYNGVCGSGYVVVNSAPVANVGTVYLTYNAKTGKNCVVTKRNTVGSPIYMAAYLNVVGRPESEAAVDEGEYRSYAGPVYKYAPGVCVEWGGVIGNWQTFNAGSNCGRMAAKTLYAGKDVKFRDAHK